MKRAVCYFVASAAALLLALPAGWCQAFAIPAQAQSAGQCQHCHPSAPAKSTHAPAAPLAQCCCGQPVVAVEKAISPTDRKQQRTAAIPADLPVLAAAAALGHSFCEPASPRLSAGPRLHALLGVWRC